MTFRLGFWDIEMAPATVHSWGLFNQHHSINQVMEQPYMLSYAWRWYGERRVTFKSTFHDGKDEMVKSLHDKFNEADAIVSWNGKNFDTKHAHREFLNLGMPPTADPKEIDLMLAAKSQFRFLSNKLDYVSQYLGVGAKKSTGGHELWVACMAGDPRAWNRMRTYNKQDVNLLVDLYDRLLPWIKNHPNLNLYEVEGGCPRCGSDDSQKRGFIRTGVSKFQRYQCNKCGGWFKSGKSQDSTLFRL
jgi:DNA polymerase elongation subunit (family B)